MTYAQLNIIVNAKASYIAKIKGNYLEARKHGQRDMEGLQPSDVFELTILKRLLDSNKDTKYNSEIRLPVYLSVERLNKLLSVIKL